MSLTILLELGHDASLKPKKDHEGFTHDWEVFVRGQNGAKIQYYVEKVVFYLHESFPKPKRVVKDPPFSIKTSGYAGFKFPIEVYLKNNQEPKKITFEYDLNLQPNGPPIHIVQKEKYTFPSPSEEFRNKLLKGGAVGEGSGNQEGNINRTIEDKNQMTSKPKLGASDITKKHKMKLEEPRTTDFENLFGPPIKKTSKLPEAPKPKEPPPPKPPNTDKSSEKDKSDKIKSNKSTHKDKEKDKDKSKEKSSENADKRNKDEKRKSKDDKSKDRERAKEKSSKKDKEREKSPPSRPRSPSPKRSPRREPSPPPVQKHSSSKEKEPSKEEKKEKDRDKDKKEDKKSKKDKRDHKEGKHKDREKDKEHREHKSKDSSKSREKESSSVKKESSPALPTPVSSQNSHKTDKKPKEKEQIKEQPKEEEKVERPEKIEKVRNESEDRQKHKHKKKDRKEKKEEKHSKKEERKNDKHPSSTSNSKEVPIKEEKTTPPPPPPNRPVDKSNLFGSPKSNSPSTPKEPEIKIENNALFSRDDESSNDSVKMSSREASPVPRPPSKSPSPPPPVEPVKKPEPEKKKEPSPKKKEKKEKKKDKKVDKEKDHEKKKKRKSDPIINDKIEPPEKLVKVEEENNSDEESKVSSTEDTTAIIQPKSECDMDMLRELQRKIMSLKDNSDLQKVVQLIAETGQYEVSAHTFDFDLCLLDRSTVRQLQDFFSTIS